MADTHVAALLAKEQVELESQSTRLGREIAALEEQIAEKLNAKRAEKARIDTIIAEVTKARDVIGKDVKETRDV